MTKGKKLARMAIAASAAALFIAGCESAGGIKGVDAAINCTGVNGCKGLSDCKVAQSNCAGLNDCKGLGFVSVSRATCQKLGGQPA